MKQDFKINLRFEEMKMLPHFIKNDYLYSHYLAREERVSLFATSMIINSYLLRKFPFCEWSNYNSISYIIMNSNTMLRNNSDVSTSFISDLLIDFENMDTTNPNQIQDLNQAIIANDDSTLNSRENYIYSEERGWKDFCCFLDFARDVKNKEERAKVLHSLVTIFHPFQEGNGRTARFLYSTLNDGTFGFVNRLSEKYLSFPMTSESMKNQPFNHA